MSASLVPTFGAVLIGNFISAALYGLTTLQVYLYFRKRWDVDPMRLKAFILYIWMLETVHACQLVAFLFRSLILEFGNPAALEVTRVSEDVTTLITGLIIFFCALVLCPTSLDLYAALIRFTAASEVFLSVVSDGARYRIILVAVVAVLATTHFGLEIAVMVLTFKYPEFSQFRKITGAYTGSMAVAAACDIVIAVAMWHLLDSRRSGVKSTNFMVDRIITFVLTTGTLTSVVDLAILICFVAMPNNLVYLAIFGTDQQPLNARQSLGKMSNGGSTSFALSDLRSPANTASTPHSGFDRRNNLSEIAFAPPKAGSSGLETFDSGITSHV